MTLSIDRSSSSVQISLPQQPGPDLVVEKFHRGVSGHFKWLGKGLEKVDWSGAAWLRAGIFAAIGMALAALSEGLSGPPLMVTTVLGILCLTPLFLKGMLPPLLIGCIALYGSVLLLVYPAFYLIWSLLKLIMSRTLESRRLELVIARGFLEVDGHAELDGQPMGRVQQQFPIIGQTEGGLPGVLQIKLGRTSLMVTEPGAEAWVFPQLQGTDEEMHAIGDELVHAIQQAAEHHGGGAAEVPEALRELQQKNEPDA